MTSMAITQVASPVSRIESSLNSDLTTQGEGKPAEQHEANAVSQHQVSLYTTVPVAIHIEV